MIDGAATGRLGRSSRIKEGAREREGQHTGRSSAEEQGDQGRTAEEGGGPRCYLFPLPEV